MNITNRRSAGFSLIEVLIALVILSVGLLGIAAMVSVSLKSKDGSYLQTQATALAQAMLDRMRANRAQADLGTYNVGYSTALTPVACMGSAHPCTAAQIATFDMVDWKNSIANTLPSGQGKIATVAVAQMTQVTISIKWNDQRAAGTASASTVTYTMVSGL